MLGQLSNANPPIFSNDDKYNGMKWVRWKLTITTAAKARGMLGYLDGTITCPIPPTTPDPAAPPAPPTAVTMSWRSLTPSLDEWETRDTFAQALIVHNIKDPIGEGVNLDGTAAEAWKSLTSFKDVVTNLVRIGHENNLRNTRYIKGTDLATHFTSLRTKCTTANAQGAAIDDERFGMIVLSTMPSSWDMLVLTLYDCKTLSQVIQRLTLHGECLAQSKGSKPTNSSSSQALFTQQKVHSTEICGNKQCGHRGHIMDRCFWPGGGMEGQFPSWWGKKGGGAAKGSSTATAANIATTPNTNVTTMANSVVVTEHTEHHVLATIATADPTGEPITYADTAASDHCWINREDFDTYQPLASCEGSGAPVGSTFPIAGVGTVRKSITHNGKQITLTFENSLHTPMLQHNLISIGHLDCARYSATFRGGGVNFHDPKGHLLMSGHGRGTMYVLDLNPPEPRAYVAKSHNKLTDLETWHRRFGHISEAGVRELASKGMVEGLNITSLETRGRCEDCIYGKHTHQPFDEVVTPETEVLERAHLDLWGRARMQSMGGKSYMMLIEDRGSSHMEGYFLDSKSAETTLAAFSHYHVMAERQTGRKLRYVRTDGGPE
jgi:hypothetical protein